MCAADAVGGHGTHDLGTEEVRFERLARSRGPGGRDDDDVVGGDQVVGERGGQGEGDRGGIAAGHGDPLLADEVVALGAATGQGELGHPVRPVPGMGRVVELLPLPAVLEPEVGTAVDDDRVRVDVGDERARWPCGRARKTTSWSATVAAVVSSMTRAGERGEVGVDRAERGAGTARRGQRPDLNVRVLQQQPQDLSPGIATRPDDGCSHHDA